MKRGDIVTCVLTGDDGKPRPAVIVQADLFNSTHASVTICPITTHLVEAPLFRVSLAPLKRNGLKQNSQIMVDKIMSLKREKIHTKIGVINSEEQNTLDHALKNWLDLNESIF